ncbi:MAG: ABC transporter permease [Methanosarcina thermophila]|jgi:ABC-2 type transport system permease protein|uniref:ABC transporter, permease protein n=3 Tax=Methanosarcina thermophila TaxID=2210 RepID=A0A1I6Z3S6_METTE|nr:ABC transporter permease [Methanosarcina thermophila]ALK06358.1 MAG: multidrug ABC transporter permease [Methanosarcina sp. 795]AKB12017.1 ABC transporter, permease protein [Methanosarcina thermophila TM-1]AKB14790.1 ABC transporter, permease protein [Methanosarcina thermophila CHTI-55]NLU56409.1 ABC transporter permease [Methanosarcina thermophila]SFT57309.1 ABC-2 type transport system permease protein [Methanosarcina thermophila]
MHTGFLTIYWRDMLRFVRFRTLLFASLVQPALWLAFFGIAMSNNFERLTATMPAIPGVKTVGYLTFIGAGVIAMTTLFTSLFGGTVLLFDKNWGLMRETLSSPLPRIHIIIGIGLSAMTKSLIQASVIMGFGLLLGVEFFEGYTPAQTIFSLLGIGLFIGAFSLGFLFLSAAIAITMESPEGMQAVITLLTMPFFFTSNALYPVNSFPPVLRALSTINPLTHLVSGIRYFAIGSDFSSIGLRYTYTQQGILISFIALLAFAGIMFLIARWRFTKVRVT